MVPDDVRERLAELLRDIGELPEHQQGALLLHDFHGLPYSAVAFALGISPAAAKQAVYEAHRALHDYTRGWETGCEARGLSRGASGECEGGEHRSQRDPPVPSRCSLLSQR